jgi:hypothetical protein
MISNPINILNMSEVFSHHKIGSSNSFQERFKGKTNKVPKDGISALLLKGSMNDADAKLYDIKVPRDILPHQNYMSKIKDNPTALPSRGTYRSNSIEKGKKTRRDSLPGDLKKCPSQKLPSISSTK